MPDEYLTFPMSKMDFLRTLSKAYTEAVESGRPRVDWYPAIEKEGGLPLQWRIDYGVTNTMYDAIRLIDSITRDATRDATLVNRVQITSELDIRILPKLPSSEAK